MHDEILTTDQTKLFPLLKRFEKQFGLVGGTAIALHIGHRRSIDFDLFSEKPFGNTALINRMDKRAKIDEIIVNKKGELTLSINLVKITFFHYPYPIIYSERFLNLLKLPDLLTLAAMKAFALGQRAKWKDYIDLYFIIKDHFSVDEITQKGRGIFSSNFNEKLFRTQLSYFEDIDYRESVDFLPGFETKDEVIKKALVDYSLS